MTVRKAEQDDLRDGLPVHGLLPTGELVMARSRLDKERTPLAVAAHANLSVADCPPARSSIVSQFDSDIDSLSSHVYWHHCFNRSHLL